MTSRHSAIPALLLMTAGALVGCTSESAVPSGAGASSGEALPPSAAAASPKGAASDRSLTPREYIDAGMPAHDRDWNGKDMVAAAQVIARLNATPEKLPHYQSERSGEMFTRITSPENLEIFRNKSLPITVRLPDALDYMNGQSAVMKAYLASMMKSGTESEEMIELNGSILRVAALMVELTDEFVPTLDPQDPTYPTRMNGLKTMRGGLATMVSGSLQTLTESQAYSSESRKRLIAVLDETLPALLPAFPEGARTETVLRLKTFAADPNMIALQPELGRLSETAAKAAAPQDP